MNATLYELHTMAYIAGYVGALFGMLLLFGKLIGFLWRLSRAVVRWTDKQLASDDVGRK